MEKHKWPFKTLTPEEVYAKVRHSQARLAAAITALEHGDGITDTEGAVLILKDTSAELAEVWCDMEMVIDSE